MRSADSYSLIRMNLITFGICRSVVGGIFHEDNYESEMAFRYAVERINMHEKTFELVPLLHHVASTDSFKAERIGN